MFYHVKACILSICVYKCTYYFKITHFFSIVKTRQAENHTESLQYVRKIYLVIMKTGAAYSNRQALKC